MKKFRRIMMLLMLISLIIWIAEGKGKIEFATIIICAIATIVAAVSELRK